VNQIYDPKKDRAFQKPYIDIDEWREENVRYRYRYHYIHGGFEGTEAKFSFFFPEKEAYTGRFFHFMAPVQGNEDASIKYTGEEDKIAFAITHGAYFVESNMGVAIPFAPISDPTIIYRASAAVAEYSRKVAATLYGPHRPYGYIYGGSGGSLKTMSCFENTDVWDGAVPYVIGSPLAMPNCFTVRAHARRILRNKMAQIAEAVEVGSTRDIYDGLNEEERAALEEITKLGFPLKAWFMHEIMDDGALPVLTPLVYQHDSSYFDDFWTVPGYLGADPEGSAVRDRIRHRTTVEAIYLPGQEVEVVDDGHTGVDEAWKRLRGDAGLDKKPMIRLAGPLKKGLYLYGSQLIFLSGKAKEYRVPLEYMEDDTVVVGAGFGLADMMERLAMVRPGDEILIDNSDYIALQTYHRHQTPSEYYAGWEQYKDGDGKPIYPQREKIIGPLMAAGGAGSVQSGKYRGKMIIVATLMDESAFPWQADWYRGKVKEALNGDESEVFRLWYMENAMHTDAEKTIDPLHTVSYVTALYRALLELSDWVERGVEPADTTVYSIEDGQIDVPDRASDRKGIQPVIALHANGSDRAEVNAGTEVVLMATVALPQGTGAILEAAWSFNGEADFPVMGELKYLSGDEASATVEAAYTYQTPGTYYPVLQVSSGKDSADPFTLIRNIRRIRVVVK